MADTNAFKCCIRSSFTYNENQKKTKFGIIVHWLCQLEYRRIFCLVRCYLVTQQTSFVSEQILTETLSFVPFGPICSRQFHQRFTRAFFVWIFCQSQNLTRKSCRNDIRTKNLYIKTLIKLTPEQSTSRCRDNGKDLKQNWFVYGLSISWNSTLKTNWVIEVQCVQDVSHMFLIMLGLIVLG